MLVRVYLDFIDMYIVLTGLSCTVGDFQALIVRPLVLIIDENFFFIFKHQVIQARL